MNAQSVLTMGQEALMLLLIVSAPVLGVALVVGLQPVIQPTNSIHLPIQTA